jgi:glycosyltransferase involved in cell wall biosynthesis
MTKESSPAVSIIMPVRNAAQTLDRTLTSVLDQTYSNIVDIILAIGPSHDETSSIAKKLQARDSRVRVIENKQGTTASGLNLAAETATGTYLVRVDAHCLLPDNYVYLATKKIIETGAGNVGGVQMAIGETKFQQAVAAAMTSRFGVGDAKFHYGGKEGPVDTVYLGVYEAALFQKLGGFDEGLIRNQDYELNIRIRKLNRVVWFTPDLVVRYFPRSNIFQLFSQFFQYGCWKRKVIRKHPRSIKIRQLAPPIFIIGTLALTILAALISAWFIGPFLAYLSISIFVSIFKKGLQLPVKALLSMVFVTIHLSWGLGFLFGIAKHIKIQST